MEEKVVTLGQQINNLKEYAHDVDINNLIMLDTEDFTRVIKILQLIETIETPELIGKYEY